MMARLWMVIFVMSVFLIAAIVYWFVLLSHEFETRSEYVIKKRLDERWSHMKGQP
jgi:hypothetical protein